MRRCASKLGPHVILGKGDLVPLEGTTAGAAMGAEGPWATWVRVVNARIYLTMYKHLESAGLHPCGLESLPLWSRQRSCHFKSPIRLFLRQTSKASHMNCAAELLVSLFLLQGESRQLAWLKVVGREKRQGSALMCRWAIPCYLPATLQDQHCICKHEGQWCMGCASHRVVRHAMRCWGAANISGISNKSRMMKFQICPDGFKGGEKKVMEVLWCKNLTISIRQQVCLARPLSHSAVTKPREHFTRTKVAGWWAAAY